MTSQQDGCTRTAAEIGEIGDVRDLLTFLSAIDTVFLWLAKRA